MVRALLVLGLATVPCGSNPAEDKPKDDAQLLQGRWLWNPAEKQSDAQPQILVEKVVVKGTKLTIHYRFGDQRSTSESEFRLGQKATPKEIDFTPTAGGHKGKTYFGLYELKDGKLKICYRGPGSTRPTDFNDKRDGNAITSFIYLIPEPAV